MMCMGCRSISRSSHCIPYFRLCVIRPPGTPQDPDMRLFSVMSKFYSGNTDPNQRLLLVSSGALRGITKHRKLAHVSLLVQYYLSRYSTLGALVCSGPAGSARERWSRSRHRHVYCVPPGFNTIKTVLAADWTWMAVECDLMRRTVKYKRSSWRGPREPLSSNVKAGRIINSLPDNHLSTYLKTLPWPLPPSSLITSTHTHTRPHIHT